MATGLELAQPTTVLFGSILFQPIHLLLINCFVCIEKRRAIAISRHTGGTQLRLQCNEELAAGTICKGPNNKIVKKLNGLIQLERTPFPRNCRPLIKYV